MAFGDVPTLDEVYRKFGEAFEAAQLLEIELGTMLLRNEYIDARLLTAPDPDRTHEILARVSRSTLGHILQRLQRSGDLDALESTLVLALEARNRLTHAFFRTHNFRRNTEEGRAIMIADLETLHSAILDAYREILIVTSGVDIFKESNLIHPTVHRPM